MHMKRHSFCSLGAILGLLIAAGLPGEAQAQTSTTYSASNQWGTMPGGVSVTASVITTMPIVVGREFIFVTHWALTVPVLLTDPELEADCDAVILVGLFDPKIVLLMMVCEPIELIVTLLPIRTPFFEPFTAPASAALVAACAAESRAPLTETPPGMVPHWLLAE